MVQLGCAHLEALGAIYDAHYDGGCPSVQWGIAFELALVGLVALDGVDIVLTARGRAVVNACPAGDLFAIRDGRRHRILRPFRICEGSWSS